MRGHARRRPAVPPIRTQITPPAAQPRYRREDMTELELTRTPGDRRLYALDGVGTLRLDGGAGGRRPVSIAADDLSAIDPGLLLFAVFVVRALAEDAQGTAGTAGAAGGAAVVASG